MQTKIVCLCFAITIVSIQEVNAQRTISKLEMKQDEERVRAIVEKIVGPVGVPGIPPRFVAERQMRIEKRLVPVEEPKLQADDDDAVAVVAPPPVRLARIATLSSGGFDNWVLGNMAGKDFPKAWLNSLLKEELVVSGFIDELTTAELTKLHIAGKGDIQRLLSKIEQSRQEYEAMRHDLPRAQTFLLSTEHLANDFRRGPFGPSSVFGKTLTKIRNDRRVIFEAKRNGLGV